MAHNQPWFLWHVPLLSHGLVNYSDQATGVRGAVADLFHMARSQPWPRWEVTLPAPARSAACCVMALAVEAAAGWSRVAEDPPGFAGVAAPDGESAVPWMASAASVRAATGVLAGRGGSPGKMLGSWGTSPCIHQGLFEQTIPSMVLQDHHCGGTQLRSGRLLTMAYQPTSKHANALEYTGPVLEAQHERMLAFAEILLRKWSRSLANGSDWLRKAGA